MNNSDKLNINIKKIGVKGYDILRDISLTIHENEILAITGNNGSGKSTLLKFLGGVLPDEEYYHEEKFFYEDKEIDRVNFARNYTRFVFQDSTGCFDPLKKMRFYFRKFEGDIDEINFLSAKFKLGAYVNYADLHSYELSGGMAQRLNIILALLAKPKVLLLDEPDSSLDTLLSNILAFVLKDYAKKGNIVIITTQNLKLAEAVSGKILHLKNGQLSNLSQSREIDNE